MKDKFQLREEDLLNRNNFESWFIKIHTALKARNLLKYIESDVLSNLNKKLKEIENTDDGKIKKIKKKIKSAEKRDALTKSIIHDNITKEPFEYIKRETNAYNAMKKLEKLYKRKKTFSVQIWMDKLNSMKANNINECNNIMNQIMETFKLMELNKHSLSNQEKLGIIYNSLPEEIKLTVIPSIDDSPNEFYERITKIITFKIYADSKNTKETNNQNNIQNTPQTIIQANLSTSIKKRKHDGNKYCEICEKNGHITKECWLNPKNKKSKYHDLYLKELENKKDKNKVNNKAYADTAVIQDDDGIGYSDLFVQNYMDSFDRKNNTNKNSSNSDEENKVYFTDYNTN